MAAADAGEHGIGGTHEVGGFVVVSGRKGGGAQRDGQDHLAGQVVALLALGLYPVHELLGRLRIPRAGKGQRGVAVTEGRSRSLGSRQSHVPHFVPRLARLFAGIDLQPPHQRGGVLQVRKVTRLHAGPYVGFVEVEGLLIFALGQFEQRQVPRQVRIV